MKPRAVTPEDAQRAARASSGDVDRKMLERALSLTVITLMAEGVVLGGLGIAVLARKLLR